MRLGLIGAGSVARQALAAMAQASAGSAASAPIDAIVALARANGGGRTREVLAPFAGGLARELIVVETVDDLIAARPDLVAEAAGHEAVRLYAPALIAAGVDLVITSAGALAHEDIRAAIEDAAGRPGAGAWEICSGAVGGLDILAAARLSGLEEVVYVSRKPPRAWRGTPAERILDLDALTQERTFYEGDAAGAARDYPQNANVAATVALAGAGFAGTRVRLVADPAVTRNVHEIRIASRCADVTIRIEGHPSPDNPKTSLTTGFALAARLLARARRA